MNNISDTLLVSIDFKNLSEGVLIVGRKEHGKPIEIVNAFQGEEALNLYRRLTARKEK